MTILQELMHCGRMLESQQFHSSDQTRYHHLELLELSFINQVNSGLLIASILMPVKVKVSLQLMSLLEAVSMMRLLLKHVSMSGSMNIKLIHLSPVTLIPSEELWIQTTDT